MIRILEGDALAVLRTLPSESVQCCVTSPPYYGLRDYGVDGQMGLEASPDEYVANMVEVFREVRRVLRGDGTLWLNVGDSYNNFRVGQCGQSVHAHKIHDQPTDRRRGNKGYKEKDLLGIPWLLAFALRADGWYLRSDIIWHKPNPMPESVTDRPTKAHEYVFLLTKQARYFWDAGAVAEDALNAGRIVDYTGDQKNNGADPKLMATRPGNRAIEVGPTRNIRTVWTIATQPFSGSHFATMPPDLVERCVRAGSSEKGCCAGCGAPWVRQTETQTRFESGSGRAGNQPIGKYNGTEQAQSGTYDIRMGPVKSSVTTGFAPSCACNASTVPCTILDPFGGAGTTGLVADRLGRDAILIELNPAYAQMARERIAGDSPLLVQVS